MRKQSLITDIAVARRWTKRNRADPEKKNDGKTPPCSSEGWRRARRGGLDGVGSEKIGTRVKREVASVFYAPSSVVVTRGVTVNGADVLWGSRARDRRCRCGR
ncbi:ORFL63W [Human betaherpesvirus 5]|nr:ORFL63W [Human betaherpesvirus 5]QHX40370.1 ORFL63W [Human betaherpesvirus 5]